MIRRARLTASLLLAFVACDGDPIDKILEGKPPTDVPVESASASYSIALTPPDDDVSEHVRLTHRSTRTDRSVADVSSD